MEISSIQDFAGLLIVAALLAVVVQGIKAKWGVSGFRTKMLTIGLALVVSGFYVWIQSTPYFATFISVLTGASAIWAIFMNNNKPTTSPDGL